MTAPTHQTYRHRILTVQLYIQEHLDEELSLERLARLAHFSPFHFHRIFKALAGEGVNEYVRRLRLESAAMLLKATDRPVTQIAFDAGYGTHEAFTRAFRQMFGVSPSQFRAGRREAGGAAVPEEEESIVTEKNVRLETMPPLRVAFVRHLGPYDQCGDTFTRLMGWAGRRGLFGPATRVLGVCWDDPDVTPPDKIRFDCCVSVGDDFRGEGEVGVQTIEGGPAAVLTVRGPYTQLGEAYRWLYGVWLPASGRELRNVPPVEIYRNSPLDTPPEQLLTDICVPLAP